MPFLAAIPAAVWIGTAIAGTVLSAKGQQQQGAVAEAQAKASARAAEFAAQQYETVAGQKKASAQRAAGEKRRQSSILQSRALALAAASGGGASDHTVMKIISDLAGQGSYLAALDIYGGEEEARLARMQAKGLRYQASATRSVGAEAGKAGNIAALGTLIGSGMSLYGKYGIPGSKTNLPSVGSSFMNPSYGGYG